MASHFTIFLFRCSNRSYFSFRNLKQSCKYINELNIKERSYSVSSGAIQERKNTYSLIDQSVDDILSTIDRKDIDGFKSVAFLKAFRIHTQFKGLDYKAFTSDPRFEFLCNTFLKDCAIIPPNYVISALRSLLELGLPPNSLCVVSAENKILRNVPDLSIFNLIVCLNFHQKFTVTDLQKDVVAELVSNICSRIHEVSNASTVTMLCNIFPAFDQKQKKIIEQKVVELLLILSVKELCKIVCTLSEKSDRNNVLLNAISDELIQRNVELDLKDVINVFYAFKNLNYCNPSLFSYLLRSITPQIHNIKQPTMIAGLLTTLGYLRWKSTDILDACCDWMENNISTSQARVIVSFVLANAALNYSTLRTKCVIESFMSHIQDIKSPPILLDIAWSLAILDAVPKDLLVNVLSPSFYKPLLNDSEFKTSSGNNLKLLNLKGVLKLKYPEYLFSTDLHVEPTKLQENTDIENCRKHVIHVLSNLVPKENYLSLNQVSENGIFIDAEFIMDKSGKPLPLLNYGTLNSISNAKPLPEGSTRCCLLIMFHKDYTLNTVTLTGINALSQRLLAHLGYTIIEISYDKFSENKTELQKTKYLSQQIVHAIKHV